MRARLTRSAGSEASQAQQDRFAQLSELVKQAKQVIDHHEQQQRVYECRRILQEEIFKCGRSETEQAGGDESDLVAALEKASTCDDAEALADLIEEGRALVKELQNGRPKAAALRRLAVAVDGARRVLDLGDDDLHSADLVALGVQENTIETLRHGVDEARMARLDALVSQTRVALDKLGAAINICTDEACVPTTHQDILHATGPEVAGALKLQLARCNLALQMRMATRTRGSIAALDKALESAQTAHLPSHDTVRWCSLGTVCAERYERRWGH